MISNYYWDCPKCSKAEKPRMNTVTEFFRPDFDFETQTTVYACNRCGWAYKRVYSHRTKRTTDYEISFDEKGNVISKQVQVF
jgi:uncharacterized Zn finger protein